MSFSEVSETLFSKTGGVPLKKCFIGFDGFTDEIISVVDKIIDPEHRSFLPTIESFGKKLIHAAEKSCNFELVVKQRKLGGNAPIFTNALLKGGHEIIFAGAIGEIVNNTNEIEPLFEPMANCCSRVFPLAKSAKTEALEFNDGKVILGKMDCLKKITVDHLANTIGVEFLYKIFETSDLFVSANWTMLPYLTDIWKHLLKIAPNFSKQESRRLMFVDLADPSKRTDEDLMEALDTLSKLNNYYDVILGLNISETEIICKLFDIDYQTNNLIKEPCLKLFDKLKISRLVVHHSTFAASIDKDDFIHHPSLHIKEPALTTGAGDNFNAGYCNALLHGLNKNETLKSAILTAGFYVRVGHSPSMQELKDFCNLHNY